MINTVYLSWLVPNRNSKLLKLRNLACLNIFHGKINIVTRVRIIIICIDVFLLAASLNRFLLEWLLGFLLCDALFRKFFYSRFPLFYCESRSAICLSYVVNILIIIIIFVRDVSTLKNRCEFASSTCLLFSEQIHLLRPIVVL